MKVYYVRITRKNFFFQKVIFLDFMSHSFLRISQFFRRNEGMITPNSRLVFSLLGLIPTVFKDFLWIQPEFSDFAFLKWPKGPKLKKLNFVFAPYFGIFLHIFIAWLQPSKCFFLFLGSKSSYLKKFNIFTCRYDQIMTHLNVIKVKIYDFRLDILRGSTSSRCRFRYESEEKHLKNTKPKKYLLAQKLRPR